MIDAIAAAGGPTYQYRQIDPQTETRTAAQPGGNIRRCFLFRTDRGLAFVDRLGGTRPLDRGDRDRRGAQLTLSPGRIDPTHPAWTRAASRSPASSPCDGGETSSSSPTTSTPRAATSRCSAASNRRSGSAETQRHQQATSVNAFVQRLTRADPAANVIVAGDINDFEFSRDARHPPRAPR